MMERIPPDRAGATPQPVIVPAERLAGRFAERRSPLGDQVHDERAGTALLAVPQPAGLVILHGARPGPETTVSAVLPLGPDRWLVVHETLPGGAMPVDRHHGTEAAEDASHAFTRIRVAGDGARRVLATGVAIDLHAGAFPAGASAATAYREVFVVLHAVEDDVVDVYVLRSFARSLWRWLHAAADA